MRAKQLTIKVFPEDIPILEEYARRTGHTLSGYLRFIVHEWVKMIAGNLDPVPASSVAAPEKQPAAAPPVQTPAPVIDGAPADPLPSGKGLPIGLLSRLSEEKD